MMTNSFASVLQWTDDALSAGGVAHPFKSLFHHSRQQAMQAARTPLAARLHTIPQRHRPDDTWQPIGVAALGVIERLARKRGA